MRFAIEHILPNDTLDILYPNQRCDRNDIVHPLPATLDFILGIDKSGQFSES